ncbi:MAG: hypothetical protein COA79_15105 [Planctomycetota bacterium]|nr:MAG: hypothetical protein COA79_15105 [Planctomycetota bacterium]
MEKELILKNVQGVLETFGIDQAEYIQSLIELEADIKEQIEATRVAINDEKDAHETFIYAIYAIIGSTESLGLEYTFKKSKELEKSYKDALDDNALENIDELINIFEQEITVIREDK